MSNNMIANRYEVFQHIGQGGMADVFLAVDTILNRHVAIKILRSELCTDAVSVLRFEREAQAATALSHPNIVEIYDVGEYKGHHYIVMEYVPGKTLKQVIRDRGALLKEEAVDIAKQLVSATAEAHRRGIIHRDIKPQNVIVKSDGSIKILDFGIALAKGSMQLTQANNVMGSVHYLAPELARGEPATVQSDIYALGIVLYEMLTGDVPFKAENAVQVALMQMRNELPDCQKINPTIPMSVANIITKATSKDRGQRYQSCQEMLNDLRVCLLPENLNQEKLVLKPAPKERRPAAPEQTHAMPVVNDNRIIANTGRQKKQHEVTTQQKVVRPAVQKKPKKRLLNRIALGVLIVLLSLLAVSGIYFALSLSGILSPRVEAIMVPDIIGMTLTEAKEVCTDSNLVLDTSNVTYTLTESTEKGHIIAVEPEIGTEIETGSRITVTVSSGVYALADNFVGMNIGTVREMISNPSAENRDKYRNIVLTVAEQESDTAQPGEIIAQELLEPNMPYNPETKTEMRLVYASYPTVVIPGNIEGMAVDEAAALLEGMGVRVLTSNLDYSSLPQEQVDNLQFGIVIKSDPEMGSEYTQREDNYITLFFY
ncbi:MAG: Stk1 family PASTA domain-containing Ser/Thr kinase [Solobacterium sp.]|nr:Stk1 family PASTA domain-containing Ser/Thr kinase [Solobacterium sp.]MBQ1321588.1 Stk1 family PASTA domain-containing Ser/Thr kinase [Solobacterium sp.]